MVQNDEKLKNMFDWIEDFIAETGCDYDTASRMYDAEHFPDYNPEDYNFDNSVKLN